VYDVIRSANSVQNLGGPPQNRSPGTSNQVCNVHWHLLDLRVVVSLNVLH